MFWHHFGPCFEWFRGFTLVFAWFWADPENHKHVFGCFLWWYYFCCFVLDVRLFFLCIAIPYAKPYHGHSGIILPHSIVTHDQHGTSLPPLNLHWLRPIYSQTTAKSHLWAEPTRIRWRYSLGPEQNRNSHIVLCTL